MFQAVCNAFCVIMCLFGIFSALWLIICRILCKRDCGDIITVVFSNNSSELPDKVYSALLMSKHRIVGSRDIYVLDREVPPHIKILCQSCADNLGRVHFISEEEVLNIFHNRD